MLAKWLEKKGIFYGWVVVACGILVMAVTHGVVQNCFSLFIKPVTEDLGLTRQGFSTCMTLINVIYMVISLFSGKIFAKFKVHALMKLACVALPVVYFGYSLCTELWMFYLVSALAGTLTAFLTFLPFTLLIANWFEEKRGLAIGITFMGSGLGGMLFNALASGWVEDLGWQTAFRILAIIMAAVMVPIIWLALRPRPQDVGLQPLGVKETDHGAVEKYGYTLKQALRMPGFWAMLALALTVGMSSTMLANTIVPHLSDVGFSASHASMVMSAYLGILSGCKILLGGMYDKLGMKKASVITFSAIGVGLTGLLLGGYLPAHILVVLGAALGCAAGTVAYPILTEAAFGTMEYATIYGIISAMHSLACSINPIFSNAIYDATKSYNIALWIGLAFVVVALSTLLIIKPVKRGK